MSANASIDAGNRVDPMTGPGGVRRFRARWVLTARLRALAPVHLGGGPGPGLLDMELLRDSVTGGPLLPGTSLAGALRESLRESLLGEGVVERACRKSEGGPPEDVARLFGGASGDDDGEQSPLVVFDAHASGKGVAVPEIRDGIRIEPSRGVVAAHFKYDLEAWPRGTTFDLRLDVQVPDADDDAAEARLLALLVRSLDGVADGRLRLGAKGRRGLGACELIDVRARRFALGQDAAGWLEWLATGLDDAPPTQGRSAQASAERAIAAEWSGGEAVLADLQDLRSSSCVRRLRVAVPLHFRGGLLLGAPESSQWGADSTQLRSGGEPVLSGSSAGGVLRQAARRIARHVREGADGERWCTWVEELFGSEPRTGDQSLPHRRSLRQSRLTVEEGLVEGGSELQVTRIELDRFTQAPVDGALVQEEPLHRGRTVLALDLRLPPDRADGGHSAATPSAEALCGMLLLVVKEVLLGDLPFGGTTGVGRGALEPATSLKLRRDAEPELHVDLRRPDPRDRALLDGWVRAFHEHRPLRRESRSEEASS